MSSAASWFFVYDINFLSQAVKSTARASVAVVVVTQTVRTILMRARNVSRCQALFSS
jgi:hypothetical protein